MDLQHSYGGKFLFLYLCHLSWLFLCNPYPSSLLPDYNYRISLGFTKKEESRLIFSNIWILFNVVAWKVTQGLLPVIAETTRYYLRWFWSKLPQIKLWSICLWYFGLYKEHYCAGGITHMVEVLSSKCKSLSSNPTTSLWGGINRI
jgi:hypothetical protein